MIRIDDLNALVPTRSATSEPDTPLDTSQLVATQRRSTPDGHEAPADPLDDDALLTWEDAEWQ